MLNLLINCIIIAGDPISYRRILRNARVIRSGRGSPERNVYQRIKFHRSSAIRSLVFTSRILPPYLRLFPRLFPRPSQPGIASDNRSARRRSVSGRLVTFTNRVGRSDSRRTCNRWNYTSRKLPIIDLSPPLLASEDASSFLAVPALIARFASYNETPFIFFEPTWAFKSPLAFPSVN